MQHTLLGQTAQARPGAVPDYVHNVYPFLGVDWGGNTFVGAAVPFGMVKLGPDMESFDSRPSSFGYHERRPHSGLQPSSSQWSLRQVWQYPRRSRHRPLDLADIKSPRIEEVNHPGYYATTLTRYNVRAELTATRRVGFHRYTFPASQQSHLTINIDHCLNKGTGSESQRFLGGNVRLLSDHEAEGVGRYAGGWNKGGEYRVYFYIVLDTPAASAQTWDGNTLTFSKEVLVDGDRPIGATFNLRTHAGQVVQAKVALSFISTEQARQNMQREAPAWNFDAVRKASVENWNQALSKIRLRGETDFKADSVLHRNVSHHAHAI